ncbi:MAG: GAF domain-containing protein [Planctomycetota bacterium]
MSRRVLILCTGNSCRSQMAQYLWSELGGGGWDCHSAGSRPAGFVHPEALAALAEIGIDAHQARSKPVDEFARHSFDLVITVCDSAHEACPVFAGAIRQEHWPFDDPADATGSDAEVRDVFRRVRDEIQQRIATFLAAERSARVDAFRGWMENLLDLYPSPIAASREEAFRTLVATTANHLAGADPTWPQVPMLLREHFAELGWEWNGIYALRTGVLQLVTAAGPPVCATLERTGGVGSSGMCHDAVLMGQAIVAARAKRWPGYVSCDGESGLGTVAGMAVPLRNPGGQIVAVWDLDSTQPLLPEDVFFCERYLASLGPFEPWPAMFR